MEQYRWTHEGMQLWHFGEYYEVEEVDDKISMLESALADANEDNSTLETTIADLRDEISQLNSVLEEIQQAAQAAL